MIRARVRIGVAALLAAGAAIVAAGALATTPGRNGLLVFHAEVNGHNQLFTIAPDGSGLKQVTHFTDASDASNADWSPDGKRIVFERDFPYPHAGVYTMNADGGDVKAVTPNRKLLFEGSPAYAPDGGLVAAAREVHYDEHTIGRRDHGEIVVERIDGTGVHAVSPRLHLTVNDVPHLDDPTFSPDGKWITFVRVNQDEVLQALF